MAVKTFKENASKAVKVLLNAIPKIAEEEWRETIQTSVVGIFVHL